MGWTTKDIPAQAGRLAVVTGATGGLGFETAAALLAAGAQVVIASRDAAKGTAALARLAGRGPPDAVRFERLDLADLASVRAFADGLLAAGRPLDLLVNNAGLMGAPRRRTTADGFEEQFGVNYLGAFALTGRLLPLLRAAARARVVGVSSLAHTAGRPDFADLQSADYSPLKSYGRSKAALLMFVRAFQRRSGASSWGVDAVGAHPGWAATDFLRPQPGLAGLFVKAAEAVTPVFAQTAADGALPVLYAATAPEAEPGGYYGPGGPLELRGASPRPARAATFTGDKAAQDRLWAQSEALTGVAFG